MKKLGKIYQYDYDGNLIAKYDSIKDAVLNSEVNRHLYNFETSSAPDLVLKREGIQFFGTLLKLPFDGCNIENSDILTFNDGLRRIYSHTVGAGFEKDYKEYKKNGGRFKYETYKNRRIEKEPFSLNWDVIDIYAWIRKEQKKKKQRELLNLDDYNTVMESILSYYNQNNIPFIKEVTDLKEYKKIPGIYILCFEKYRGYYVGKTKRSIYTRVLQHYQVMGNGFDVKYEAESINKIYALPCTELNSLILEPDIISRCTPLFSLNQMAGGLIVDFVDSPDYTPTRYTIKNSAAFLEIRKECMKLPDQLEME